MRDVRFYTNLGEGGDICSLLTILQIGAQGSFPELMSVDREINVLKSRNISFRRLLSDNVYFLIRRYQDVLQVLTSPSRIKLF